MGTKTKQKRSYTAAPVRFEPLESRNLFSADLVGSFAPFEEPVQVAGSRIEIDLDLRNAGSSSASGPLNVDFYASRDAHFDPAVDPFVSRERVRGRLAPGESALATFNLTVPLNLPGGNWRAIAVLNPEGKVAESNLANNTLVSQVGTIVIPDYDLTGSLGNLKFPPSLVTGQAAKGSAQVLLANAGTAAFPRSAAVDVRLYARPDDAGRSRSIVSQDILLGEARNQKLRNLQPGGRAKAVNLRIATDADLPAATYRLVVAVDPSDRLAESDESNNVTVLTGQTFTAAAPFHELHAAIASNARLPWAVVSGDGTRIRLPLTVTNHGNVALDRGQTIDVAVYADRIGGGSTLITTAEDVSVSNLRPGKTKKLNLNVQLPPGLADGDYQLRVVADAAGDVPQSTTAGNTARASQIITVAEGFFAPAFRPVDIEFLGEDLISYRTARLSATFEIINRGNLAYPKGARLDSLVSLRRFDGPDDGSEDILGGTTLGVSVSNLKPGQSKRIQVDVVVDEDSVEDDTYFFGVAADLADGSPITNATDLGTPQIISYDYLSAYIDHSRDYIAEYVIWAGRDIGGRRDPLYPRTRFTFTPDE